MPKLNEEVAQKVDQAESAGFEPVPEGVYVLELMEDVEVREGAKGVYWRWAFQVPEGEGHAGRRFWTNTSLSDNAFWKLKETFDAFGVPTNTDTEDLVKRRVKAVITITTMQQGKRAGELTNEIDKLLPLDSDEGGVPAQGGEKVAAGAADDSKPLF